MSKLSLTPSCLYKENIYMGHLETYNCIDEKTKDELGALAKEHMQRVGIPIHPDNVERAVVNMFNRIMLKRLSE
jgi:hypothetical protein